MDHGESASGSEHSNAIGGAAGIDRPAVGDHPVNGSQAAERTGGANTGVAGDETVDEQRDSVDVRGALLGIRSRKGQGAVSGFYQRSCAANNAGKDRRRSIGIGSVNGGSPCDGVGPARVE